MQPHNLSSDSSTQEYCRGLVKRGDGARVELKISFQKEVNETLVAYGLPEPVFEVTQGSMAVTVFKQLVQSDSKIDGVNSFIYSISPRARAVEMALAFDVTKRTIERSLRQLKEAKAIEFRGSAKTGGYFALQEVISS